MPLLEIYELSISSQYEAEPVGSHTELSFHLLTLEKR